MSNIPPIINPPYRTVPDTITKSGFLANQKAKKYVRVRSGCYGKRWKRS